MLENCEDIYHAEAILSRGLQSIELIGEIDLSDKDVCILASFIKDKLQADINKGADFLKNQAPACLVCYLVWEGIISYRKGNYWSAVQDRLGLNDTYWQNIFGQIFIDFIKEKNLPRFDIPNTQKNITPILTHGGIPNYCLFDFFEKVLYPTRKILIDPNDDNQVRQELTRYRRKNKEMDDIHKEIIYYKGFKDEIEDKRKRYENLISLYDRLHEIKIVEDELAKIEKLIVAYSSDPELYRQRKLDEIKRFEIALEDVELMQYACQEFANLYGQVTSFNEKIQKNIGQIKQILLEVESSLNINKEDIQNILDKELCEILERQQKSMQFVKNIDDQLIKFNISIQERVKFIHSEIEEFKEKVTNLGKGDYDLGIQKIKSYKEMKDNLQSICYQLNNDYQNLNDLMEELAKYKLEGLNRDTLVFKERFYQSKLDSIDKQIAELEFLLQYHANDFPGVDEPVLRYLFYGGDHAERFFILSMKMLNMAINGESLSSSNLSLPERIIKEFLDWWRNRQLAGTDSQATEKYKSPVLYFDLGLLEFRVRFPSQTLSVYNGDEAVRLSFLDSDQPSQECKLRIYRQGDNIYTTEPLELTLAIPSKEYYLELIQNAKVISSWTIRGIESDNQYMAFDIKSGKFISKDQLNKNEIILITKTDTSIYPEEVIVEKYELYGEWKNYKYSILDLSCVNEIQLKNEYSQELKIPVLSNASSSIEIVGNAMSRFCKSEGDIIYHSKLPVIRIPSVDRLIDWTIYLSPCKESIPNDYCSYLLSELVEPGPNKTLEISLSDEKLLGNSAFGRFTVRIIGPYKISEDFNFCFVSKIEEKFDKSLYLPDDDSSTVNATVSLGENLQFKPSSPAKLKPKENNSFCVQTELSEECINGILCCYTEKESHKLPLTINIPKLYWRIHGLPNGAYSSWCDKIGEVDLSEWESASELYLDIKIPDYINGIIRITCGLHEASRRLSEGKAKFNLLEFNDTLRSGLSDGKFKITILDTLPEIDVKDALIFEVTTELDIQAVECTVIGNGVNRTLKINWTENKKIRQGRVVRLWNLQEQDSKPVVEKIVEMGSCEVLIENVSCGNYRVEVNIVKDKDSWNPDYSLPLPSDSTKDIVVDPIFCCKNCDYSSLDEEKIINHIKEKHIISFIKHLSYNEIRQKYRLELPNCIYKCKYCSFYCYGVLPNPTSTISNHVENCPQRKDRGKSLLKVEDIDEIRARLIQDLPYVYKCKICSYILKNDKNIILDHLLEKHKDELYSKK